MANTLKEAVAEKVKVMDQYKNEMTEHKGFNYWLIIPAVLTVATATGGFFLVRRFLGASEK